ncbi:hypothetical protein GGF31_004456 [Allomyces arbusculus]|nr:hypothetical protein GGF31_004456 [Allomyces arbusculus]
MPGSSTDPPSMPSMAGAAGAPPRILIDARPPHAPPNLPSTALSPSPSPAPAPTSPSAHRGSASGVNGPGTAGRVTSARAFRGSGDTDSSVSPSPTSPSTASAAAPPPPPAPQTSSRRPNQMTGSTSDSVGQPTYASMRRAQQNTYVSLSRNANATGYMSLARGAPAPVVVPASTSANHGGLIQTYMIAPQPGVVTTLLPAVPTLSRPALESRPPTLRERVAQGAQRHRTAIGAMLGLLVAGLLFLVMAVTMDISIPVAASSSVPVGVLVAALVKTVALRRRRGVGEFRPAGNVPVISRFSLDKFSAKSHSSLQSARDSSATTTRPDPTHASAHGHDTHPLRINFSPIVTVDRITVTSAGGLTVSTTSMPPTNSLGSSRAPSISDVQRSDTQRSDTDMIEPVPPPPTGAPAAASPSPGPGPPPQETYTFQLSVPGGIPTAGGSATSVAGMPSSFSIQISPASVTDLSTRLRLVSPSAAATGSSAAGPGRGDAEPARSPSPPPVAARTFTADPDPIDDTELHDATPPSLPPAAHHHPRRHPIRRSASAALADAPAPSSSSSRPSRTPHGHQHRHDAASPVPSPRPVGLTKSESARVMPTARHPSPTDPLTASPRASRKHGHGHGSTKLALLRERVIEDIVQYKSHVDLDEASNDALPAATGADVGSPPGQGGSRRLRTATSAAYMAARPAAGGEVTHGGGSGGGSARIPRSASLAAMSASNRASKADQWRPVGGVAAGSAGGRVGEVIREQAYYEASMEIQKWVTSTDHVLV